MIIFPIVIIFSLIAYVYFKVAESRHAEYTEREKQGAKANISLGLFIAAFGINSYVFYQTQLAAVIGLIFFVLGTANIVLGTRKYKQLSGAE
ncbi:YtpI family protein [Alkalicoccus urumqiensis]|nr:YtpI family protein [Alkalicoccus urumqiensis]